MKEADKRTDERQNLLNSFIEFAKKEKDKDILFFWHKMIEEYVQYRIEEYQAGR